MLARQSQECSAEASDREPHRFLLALTASLHDTLRLFCQVHNIRLQLQKGKVKTRGSAEGAKDARLACAPGLSRLYALLLHHIIRQMRSQWCMRAHLFVSTSSTTSWTS